MMGERQAQAAAPLGGGGNYITDEEIRRMTAGMPPAVTTPNPGMQFRNEWTEDDARRLMKPLPMPSGPMPSQPMRQSPMPALSDEDMARLREMLAPRQQMPMSAPFGALR